MEVLTPGGWLGPARIRWNERGVITEVSRLDVPGDAPGLSGPMLAGMPNLHSHAFQRQMAGLTQTASSGAASVKDSFWTWRKAMYELADRISPEQLRSIAAWLYGEMLESGYTSCAEFHYLHHQRGGRVYADLAEMSLALLEAADMAGISLTLLPVLYCRGGFASAKVTGTQRRFQNSPERFMQLLDACRRLAEPRPLHCVGIAAHSLRAVSVEQLREVLEANGGQHVPVHIHIAEQIGEVEECMSELGARPVEWLLNHFGVDRHWCLVHATHLQRKELEAAAKCGATAGLCPTTEADLGDGLFAAEDWIEAGGSFGIGSDSNIRVSVAEELRLLESGCRLRTLGRNVLADAGLSCGRTLYQRALAGGAAALGQKIGGIEPGLRADLVELEAEHPFLQGRTGDSILDTWLFAGDVSMVRSVWVGGVQRVAGGVHVNKRSLEGPFRRSMRALL